ncbi:MAG: hypothetical protein ACSHW0_03335 [Thalassotalea sp.]
MSIKTIKSDKLKIVWQTGNNGVLPIGYRHQVVDILFDIDAAHVPEDLEDLGAIQYNPDHEQAWSVTITVNNTEPCGAVTCDFWQGDCYNVDLREYNP